MSLPLNWPVSLDALANPGATTERDDPGFELDLVVSRIHDLLEAMEARFGVGSANGTPVANRVYGGLATAGQAGYRQVVPADMAGPGAGSAGTVLRTTDGTTLSLGKLQKGDVQAGQLPAVLQTVGPLGAPSTYLDFSGYSMAYAHLTIMLWCRSTVNAGSDTLCLTCNADGSTSYHGQWLYGASTSAIAVEKVPAAFAQLGLIPGSGAGPPSFTFGAARIDIPGYASNQGNHPILAQVGATIGGAGTYISTVSYALYYPATTAAVTSIRLSTAGGTFGTATTATLLGWPA